MRLPEIVVDCRCVLGEGLMWSVGRHAVLWTDIQASALWMYWPDDGSTRTWRLPDRLGSLAIGESGKLLLGLAKGLYVTDIDAADGPDLSVTLIVPVEPHLPRTRINDGRTDRAGNFVFGTMNEHADAAADGSLYQYSSRHGLRRLDLGGVTVANSICFSLDGRTMYYCDSPRRQIMQCEYEAESAQVADVREFARITGHGQPDGSVIDADGCLWNATWGAAVVRRYRPDGSLDLEIPLPAMNPTCVGFGGDALDRLYITSARQGMDEEALARTPEAGGVYSALPGVRGVTDATFRGL